VSRPVVIGITDCEKYPNYERWMLESGVNVIRLGAQFSNLDDLKKCQGLLLTGGEDIHPRFYGKDIRYENAPTEYEEERDEFEIKAFQYAEEHRMPVLGICRGLQLINCVKGGILKQDLAALNETHKRISQDDKVHDVLVVPSSSLQQIVGLQRSKVNSSHHQAIEQLGEQLKVNSLALDGTIEGIESENSSNPFLLAVQWHPERMIDQQNPLSKKIKEAFIDSARNFSL
jgi:putative glutamine amidotransferase